MNAPRRRLAAAAILVCLAPLRILAHADLTTLLNNFAEEIREHPGEYLERAERAWLLLEHGRPGSPAAEDIDTLLSHSDWRDQGNRLLAYRLFLLGKLEEAKLLIAQNIRGAGDGPEQSRLLARIELSRGDTNAAIEVYRRAWEKRGFEDDFIAMLGLHQIHGAPEALLRRGLKQYARSPGATEAVFTAYRKAGDSASLKKCLEISKRAGTWWPFSADWKLRHARVLLDLGRPREAETALLQALDLLDGDSRIQANAESTLRVRKEIFGLLQKVR